MHQCFVFVHPLRARGDALNERAGHYLGELNVLHPFREGNGRSIREFIGQLARDAGYGIDWQGVGRAEMTQASIEAYEGDSRRMASLIRDNLRDLDQEYALDLARTVAGDKAHISIAVPGQSYEGSVIGSTERYLVQEIKGRAGEMVLHSRRALLNVELASPGEVIGIRYPYGGGGLVEKYGERTDRENTLLRENKREID